jgi:hypothetical protein
MPIFKEEASGSCAGPRPQVDLARSMTGRGGGRPWWPREGGGMAVGVREDVHDHVHSAQLHGLGMQRCGSAGLEFIQVACC